MNRVLFFLLGLCYYLFTHLNITFLCITNTSVWAQMERFQQVRFFLLSVPGQIGLERGRLSLELACGIHHIGNGDNLALGALYALQQIEMSPQQRVTLALEAAAFHNATVRPPFLIECIEMHE